MSALKNFTEVQGNLKRRVPFFVSYEIKVFSVTERGLGRGCFLENFAKLNIIWNNCKHMSLFLWTWSKHFQRNEKFASFLTCDFYINHFSWTLHSQFWPLFSLSLQCSDSITTHLANKNFHS